MAVQRLTQRVREGITTRALSHRFAKEIEAVVSEKASFAVAVYNDLYSKADRQKMAAVPPGWLFEADSVAVRIGGNNWVNLYFSGRGGIPHALRLLLPPFAAEPPPMKQRVKAVHWQKCAKVYDATDALAIRYEKVAQQERHLVSQVNTAQSRLRAVLTRVTTVGGLLKLWPELAPFVAQTVSTPTKLPAIPIEELNKLFLLPVKKTAKRPV